ncbi:Fc receptor-like A isoform X1 [Ochotona princeps]|uniref:Fc receptor-like A isoform X1 n=1 Tax=Ochotona princeps TaxID=9978 RepID=UPI002714BAD6|nr:Fc receptor-like A isoform X1 [Ochotona princeps]
MKLGSLLRTWAFLLSPAMLWATLVFLASPSGSSWAMPSSTANLEIPQCEGPFSPGESSCRKKDDLTDLREDDYEVRGYTFSEPFHLIVSYDWLILQSPSSHLFEGDPLLLRCRAWQDWPLTQVTFYRDGLALGPAGPNRDFSIAAAKVTDSGRYHCSGIFRSPGPGSPETASAVAITVQELFPPPALQATSSEPKEGSLVTLSCQTKLPRQKSATRLRFSFYKDGKRVRSRSRSSEFQIPTAAEEHSGTYWCEAVTEDNQIRKQSPQLEIQVHGPSGSAASMTFNPSPQKSAAPDTPPTEPPGPPPPPPPSTPCAEEPGFTAPLRAPDPHLYHQMSILLKHMQDVKALLGHLVIELRDLSGRLKPEPTQPPAN